MGRYGAAQLVRYFHQCRRDAFNLIKGLQGLATLEWHGKKLDVYSYVGCGVRGPDVQCL